MMSNYTVKYTYLLVYTHIYIYFFGTFLFKLKPSQAKACSPSCSSKTGLESICRVCPLDSSKKYNRTNSVRFMLIHVRLAR